MRDLKTKNHVFDCNFFIERPAHGELMLRIQNASVAVVSDVFREATETALMYYRGKPYHDYKACKFLRDEGNQIFLILSKEN